LPVAGLQRLEILKVMAARGTTLILDEPTGSLSPTDAADLLSLVRRLVDRGSGAVLITHKLDEALRFGDRVTVLRRGQVALSGPIAGRSAADLAHAMLGESLSGQPPWENVLRGSVVVSAEEITIPPFAGSGPGIRSGTFQIRSGETVGVAAVEGNGERELLRAVAGLLPIASGKLTVGQPVTLVPEDRTGEGIVGQFTLAENLTLGLGPSASWVRHGLINRSAARVEAASLLQRYEIIAAGPDALAGTLSGGNQQKLILARALEQHPRVLVAENPGRGLAKLRASARTGAGVIIHSSDLDELIDWCDRILVVVQGRIHIPPREAGREALGRLLLGVQG
jgi:simple sugar transport system ATP-binding protein